MNKYYINLLLVFIMLISAENVSAQKDVTKFLGIPVDGYKPEMIEELKSKGFTISPYKKDVLVGEFNGTDVNIHIVTNNNKVYRIMVADVNTIEETDIKIRFNNLLRQFQNNKNYLNTSDSSILNYTIPGNEDISYEILVNKKRYEAIFYQKSVDYDSLEIEMGNLFKKETINDADTERLSVIMKKMIDNSFNKVVWFMISELNGKYSITMFYDNEYNKAKGDDL